jgi:hypothetical protein
MLVILAIQILNLSIYNTDFYNFSMPDNAKTLANEINPVDSFAELIVESVPGYQDTFPETSEQNGKQSPDIKHNITFKMIHQDRFAKVPAPAPHYTLSPRDLPLFRNTYSYLFYKEINHPPA